MPYQPACCFRCEYAPARQDNARRHTPTGYAQSLSCPHGTRGSGSSALRPSSLRRLYLSSSLPMVWPPLFCPSQARISFHRKLVLQQCSFLTRHCIHQLFAVLLLLTHLPGFPEYPVNAVTCSLQWIVAEKLRNLLNLYIIPWC